MSESIGKFKLNTPHLGDWVENTKDIPDQSINCVLTSPPYYGLRDYGTAEWVGGDPNCEHKDPHQFRGVGSKKQSTNNQGHGGSLWKKCKFCGAERKDKQLGLEDTSEEFITNLCNGFEEIKRALRDDGTCWVNIGDTYNKEKSLYGTPFSFALEMVKRGWLLRNTIIWHKESVMPSSVKDRFTCDFEYMFFFTKSKEYWFEQQFEPLKESTIGRSNRAWSGKGRDFEKGSVLRNTPDPAKKLGERWANKDGRNMRTIWTINKANFKGSHFATFLR